MNEVLREEDFALHETSSEHTNGPRLHFKKRPVPYPHEVLRKQLVSKSGYRKTICDSDIRNAKETLMKLDGLQARLA